MIIGARFNGPPDSGNGGYSAGLLAAEFVTRSAQDGVGDGIEVTLRRPPPLDTPLAVRGEELRAAVPADTAGAGPSGGLAPVRVRPVRVLRAYHGETLIAEATMNAVADDEVVAAVPHDRAVDAARTYAGFAAHPFPTCYVCGPERTDGLRIFPGRVGVGVTAAPFVAPDDVSSMVVWAALDCPGGWAAPLEDRPYVLGRMAARIDALPAPGDACVVVGRLVGEEGRKAHVRTSLYSQTGALLATARATWLALP